MWVAKSEQAGRGLQSPKFCSGRAWITLELWGVPSALVGSPTSGGTQGTSFPGLLNLWPSAVILDVVRPFSPPKLLLSINGRHLSAGRTFPWWLPTLSISQPPTHEQISVSVSQSYREGWLPLGHASPGTCFFHPLVCQALGLSIAARGCDWGHRSQVPPRPPPTPSLPIVIWSTSFKHFALVSSSVKGGWPLHNCGHEFRANVMCWHHGVRQESSLRGAYSLVGKDRHWIYN